MPPRSRIRPGLLTANRLYCPVSSETATTEQIDVSLKSEMKSLVTVGMTTRIG